MSALKKFSFTYVKQHPVMFGAISLVFGLFLWMLLNKGAAPANAPVGTVIQNGPTDAQIQAGIALQQTQVEANTQVALAQLSLNANADNNASQEHLATIALQGQLADIQANYNLGKSQIEASVVGLTEQLANNLAITNSNNGFMLDYAKNAQDAATAQLVINANLQENLTTQSIDLQKTLATQQLQAYEFGTTASLISQFGSPQRRETLIQTTLPQYAAH